MSPQVVLFFFFFSEAIRRESSPLEKNANKHKRDERNLKKHYFITTTVMYDGY